MSPCVFNSILDMRRSLSPTDLAQKAFVRGLADEVDEEAVRRLFSKYGTVTDGINLVFDYYWY